MDLDLDNSVTVFRCSIATDSMSKKCVFRVSSSWIIISDYSIGFSKLEVILGCLTTTGFYATVVWCFVNWTGLPMFSKSVHSAL